MHLPLAHTDINVPKKLGHAYKPVTVYTLEFLKTPWALSHRRLSVFSKKGTKCVACDRIGIYVIRALDRLDNPHIDVYTEDFHLMTVDHIHPKSLGGRFTISNLQPMCQECNEKKGNTIHPYNQHHHYHEKTKCPIGDNGSPGSIIQGSSTGLHTVLQEQAGSL